MASHQQPSPTAGMPPHHGGPHAVHPVNGHPPQLNQPKTSAQYLAHLTESVWNQMGKLLLHASEASVSRILTRYRVAVGADE